ncbi:MULTISPECIES: tripartite tricarboxylate transporter permease [unclassified Paenibacillus]|uniref:tripartite tricarboxylate transporter permease n=1 Tax=unclassified Paenibacillus TaxID=185978 RepID=UPI001AE10C53|nr:MULTISPECIES: tripartite tricarboxylate transporter permease [unclassified Paenibacillus]MBP1154981.1 putative tricarboxylic transport membrane protein [Paenibacillus sp. PvP091]MBP1169635.1 putative tricarboxylic transport membrane protein [Paenibacillus sp. PvR098]MBP2440663.1 putative tricarboxylic transport membrane protein [Paenibacillus sp. PvP052]
MLDYLALGFGLVFQWENLAAILVGAAVGYLAGVLPGLSAGMSIALLLPFTFTLDPLTSLVFLTALYVAAEYGGAITAITINVPGEAGSAPTCFDGYPLAQKGYPAKALGISMVASLFGGVFSTICLILVSVPVASMAIRFGPPEYFALGIFGLSMVASLGGKSWMKGFIAVGFGLMLTTIGIDPVSGTSRYAFDINLFEGIPLIPVLVGLFAISEVFLNLEEMGKGDLPRPKVSGSFPTMKEILGTNMAMLRGSVIGFIVGVVPGAGKAIASFIAYGEQKRTSKHPEKYGTGVLDGIAAPEAANNSVVGGALVPLLALGIPGSAAAAILIGAFTIQGLQPGPLLFEKEPGLVYGIFASLLLGNFVMLLMGMVGIPLWTKVVTVPKKVFMPIILAMVIFAAFAEANNTFHMWLALGFGFIGYLMRKYDFPVAPAVLAVVLGEMIETAFRRSLLISDGSLSIFATRPIASVILLVSLASIGYQIYRSIKKDNKK